MSKLTNKRLRIKDLFEDIDSPCHLSEIVTFKDAAFFYLIKNPPSGRRQSDLALLKNLLESMGDRKLKDITDPIIEGAISDLEKDRRRVIRGKTGITQDILNRAQKDGIAPKKKTKTELLLEKYRNRLEQIDAEPEDIKDVILLVLKKRKNDAAQAGSWKNLPNARFTHDTVDRLLSAKNTLPTKEATRESLELHLSKNNLTKKQIKDFFTTFVAPAKQNGWLPQNFTLSALDLAREKLEILEKLLAPLRHSISDDADAPLTFGVMIACIFVPYTENNDLCHVPYGLLRDIVATYGKVSLDDIDNSLIDEIFQKFYNNTANRSTVKSCFVKTYIKPAIKKGWLVEWVLASGYYKLAMEWNSDDSKVEPKDRTVGWYACKLYVDDYNDQSSGISSTARRSRAFKILKPAWNTKCRSLSRDQIAKIMNYPSVSTSYAKHVIYAAYNDGLIEAGILEKESHRFKFSDDVWKYGRRRLDFSDIENHKLKNATKHRFFEMMHAGKRVTYSAELSLLKKYLFNFMKKENIKTIKGFNNVTKKKFFRHISKQIEAKTITPTMARQAVKVTRGFFRGLDKIKHPELNKNLTWKKGEYVVKIKPSSLHKVCRDYELERLTLAIKNEKDPVIAAYIGIQMLTGRRRSEMRDLTIDCLVDVGPITYLRYYSSKQFCWHEIPLENFEVLDSGGLFRKGAVQVIQDLVDKAIEATKDYREKTNKNLSKHLFLKKLKVMNISGQLYTSFSDADVSNRTISFMKRHGLDFKYPGHGFRHTLATKLIRSGIDISSVATVLGDTPDVVAKYYEKELSELDTLKLGREELIDPIPAAERLLARDHDPIILNSNSDEECETRIAVAGGSCGAGASTTFSCPHYLKTYGEYGCMGCLYFGLSREDKAFWNEGLRVGEENAKSLRGTHLEEPAKKSLKRIKRTLEMI